MGYYNKPAVQIRAILLSVTQAILYDKNTAIFIIIMTALRYNHLMIKKPNPAAEGLSLSAWSVEGFLFGQFIFLIIQYQGQTPYDP